MFQDELEAFQTADTYLGVRDVADANGEEDEDDVEAAASIVPEETESGNAGSRAHKILYPLEWDTRQKFNDCILTDERITNAFIRIRSVNAKTAMWPPGAEQAERTHPHRGYLMESNLYTNSQLGVISAAALQNHVPHIKIVSQLGKLQIFSTGKFLLNSQSSPYRAASSLLALRAWAERFVKFEDVTHSWYRGFCVDNHVYTGKLRHELNEKVRYDPRVKQYLTDAEIKEVMERQQIRLKHAKRNRQRKQKGHKTPVLPRSSPPPPPPSEKIRTRKRKHIKQNKGATSITVQGGSLNSVAMLYPNGTVGSITGIISVEHLHEMLLCIVSLYMDYRELSLPTIDS